MSVGGIDNSGNRWGGYTRPPSSGGPPPPGGPNGPNGPGDNDDEKKKVRKTGEVDTGLSLSTPRSRLHARYAQFAYQTYDEQLTRLPAPSLEEIEEYKQIEDLTAEEKQMIESLEALLVSEVAGKILRGELMVNEVQASIAVAVHTLVTTLREMQQPIIVGLSSDGTVQGIDAGGSTAGGTSDHQHRQPPQEEKRDDDKDGKKDENPEGDEKK